ncbi:MAG TPA: glycosyltransferase family A protein [Flavobacterium sp.]|nr:glycosyltransferase family A protein [Flavobacterium sp.]
MQQPLVSVIVPCYNQGTFLPEALDSVWHQTYANWECIIINDGSTDNTDVVAAKWSEKSSRFKYISLKNGGVSNARNTGIAAANGFYILPLDGDDKIGNDYIEKLVEAMQSDSDLKMAYGAAEKFGTVNEKWELQDFSFQWLLFHNMIHCTGLFRKADFDTLPGGYDVNMHEGLEDWEFWIHFLKDRGKVKRVDSALFHYRVKEESRMTKISLQKRYRLLAYLYNKYGDLYDTYIDNPSMKIKIDYPYAFYLSAKTYTPNDTERIRKLRKSFEEKLKKEVGQYKFFTKKRLLYHWFKRGKLNLSLWDVLLK